MNKSHGFTLANKIMLISISLIVLVVAIITSIDNVRKGNIYDVIVIGLPVIVLTSYLFMTAFRRTITITDQNIIKRNFMKREIQFNEVSRINVFEDEMRVMSDGVTIPITKDIEDYKLIIKFLVRKLAPLPDVEIQGDKKFVERILSEQGRVS